MINNRGQSLSIPSASELVKDNIYVAKLYSVEPSNYEEDKHVFTYEVVLHGQIYNVRRSIALNPSDNQISIFQWLKRHSNYSPSHTKYGSYIDHEHLILVGEYEGRYFVRDVAPLNETGGIL
ncbi:hypothetical protein [Staphylococcus hominis]|uniref:hypothetical protein n=1 Tax=Staphylococcus hominis TaxID=1290 RepID=UPI00019FCAAA|nr:hypothetical protein [Staphylococcus hominis]EEK11841.1 hypothetical protein STAHO0001_0597 [Staphylococcus hominis SK119]MCI2838905.1 hypothetical protein [Staphylococcus hominis]QKH82519.1 hypothetical protein FOC68_09805 [Staphylococcus hominis]